MLYLRLVGLPASVGDYAFRPLRRYGLKAECDAVRFMGLDGLAATDVRVYKDTAPDTPVFSASSVGVLVNPLPWLLSRRTPTYRVRLRDGRLVLPTGTPDAPVLDRIDARLFVATNAIEVLDAKAVFEGLAMRAEGRIRRPPESVRPPENPYDRLRTWLARRPAWTDDALAAWTNLPHASNPALSIRFDVDPRDLFVTKAKAHAEGTLASTDAAPLERWSVDLRWLGPILRLENVSLRSDDREAHAGGSLDLRTRAYSARLFSNLSPADAWPWLPERARAYLQRQTLVMEEPPACEIWLGPAPIDRPWASYRGWIALRQTRAREAWIERAFVSFEGREQRVTWTNFEAIVGEASQRGEVKGHGLLDPNPRTWTGRFEARFDPRAVRAWLPESARRLVDDFDFDRPPEWSAHVRWPLGTHDVARLSGDLAAETLRFRGVPLDQASASFSLIDRDLTLNPLRFARGANEAEGLLRFYLGRKRCDVDARSTCPPLDIARMVGTQAVRVVNLFPVQGPAEYTATGRIDYARGGRTTDVALRLEARDIGWASFTAERAELALRMIGPTVRIERVAGNAYDGTFSGAAILGPFFQDTPPDYSMHGEARNMNLNGLLQARHKQDIDPSGKVSANIELKGRMGRGMGHTAVGKGAISVRDGRLFRLPVLGPLSYLLATVIPGVGYSTLTAFDAPFDIRDGTIQTDDARLLGDLLSIQAEGSMRLNGELDFDAQVQLLRDGPLASVLRLITFPVSWLFEVRLGGTLEKPLWTTANLPDWE